MPQIFSTSRAEAILYRFPPFFYPILMVLAMVMQAYLPLLAHPAVYLDFPLLVIVYVGMTTQNQVTSMISGGVLGLVQDSLSHIALGSNGMAKTLAGYLAASLGVRIDADHPGIRLLMVYGLYWLNALVAFGCQRFLMARPVQLGAAVIALAAFVNGLLAIFLFPVLDRFRRTN